MLPFLAIVGAFILLTKFRGKGGGGEGGSSETNSESSNNGGEEDLLKRKRPPTKEEVERKRNEILLEIEGLAVKAQLQIKSHNKVTTEMSELQSKLQQLQNQQDHLPIDALVDTAKFMAGIVPFVSSGLDLVDAMKLGNEAIELREEAEQLKKIGETDKADEAILKADGKANEMLKMLCKSVADSVPVVSDLMTLHDVGTYNPRQKVVEIELLKVTTETQLLNVQKKASGETLERIEKELDENDSRLEECRKRHQQVCESIDKQLQDRTDQCKRWVEAVKKLGPYDEERLETEDMPKLDDFGSAHVVIDKIKTQIRETIKTNDHTYRDFLKQEIEGIKDTLPPSDQQEQIDPESLKPPEQRSLNFYKKKNPTASPSELQTIKMQDVKKSQSDRRQKSIEQENEFHEQRRSKREEKLRQIEERRMQVIRDREDNEQNRGIDQTTLEELIKGREETLRDMRELAKNGNTSERDIRDVEHMFDNLEKEAKRRISDSKSEETSDTWSREDHEFGRKIDQDTAQQMTKEELLEHLNTEDETIKDMINNSNTSKEDVQTIKESYQNFREEYEKRI